MTADPGAYDVTERVAADREDAAERAADQARDDHYARAMERVGEARGGLIVRAAGMDPTLRAMTHALDAVTEACGLPAGAPPIAVEWRATQDRALADAVMAWREVDRYEGTDTTAGRDALLRLRDAADRYAGLGIGGVA